MNLYCRSKNLICFFILSFFSLYNAQVGISTFEIDTLQKNEYERLLGIGDFKGAILQEKKLIAKSKELHYTKGEIVGYLNLAKSLTGLNRNKEGLYFLAIAEKKLKMFNDDILKSRLHHIYGVNYYTLGLHQQAIESFDRSLYFAYKVKDKKEKEKLMYNVYDWKRSSFGFLGKMDSVYSNERKCMSSPKPMLYITIANRHLDNNNIDSAEYYINKANDLVVTKKVSIEGKSNVLRAFGKLYIEKNQYKKALQYLFESLAITQKMGFKKRDKETYKLISEAYKKSNNIQKENEYLTKYTILNDSLAQVERSIMNVPIEKFLHDQAEKENKNKENLYYAIIAVILMSIAVILIIANIYKARQKQKDILIIRKEQEAGILKKKLNGAVEEIIELAKKDDLSFINRFNEFYPEFSKKLLAKYSLNSNDLKFCALLKLNFSNKEIAQYGCMSIRTVESRKYRLRKKLELTSDIDLNKWMSTL